jgi:hypothetical protein
MRCLSNRILLCTWCIQLHAMPRRNILQFCIRMHNMYTLSHKLCIGPSILLVHIVPCWQVLFPRLCVMFLLPIRLRVGCHLYVCSLCRRRVCSLQRNMCRLQSGLVFFCWFLFLHKLHDGQLQPARGGIMQVVSSRNLVIYYRSLVFGHLSGMPPRYIFDCSRCKIRGYLQPVPFWNLLKLNRRFRCQPLFPLRSWVLLNLYGANFIQ